MSNTFEPLYLNIRTVLVEARRRTYQAVNSEMVNSYWHIGRMIVE